MDPVVCRSHDAHTHVTTLAMLSLQPTREGRLVSATTVDGAIVGDGEGGEGAEGQPRGYKYSTAAWGDTL